MSLTPGSRLGPYDILAALGAGGMGEVYRGRDTRLGREVALKVLPASVAADPERLARFDREARLLASLTHPNIATLHALERIDGRPVLVMELVPGDDLTVRLSRGPMPVREALPIAVQIALALEAAHDAGIVHRDLKPANVKVSDDNGVKVLDFGLAKAFGSDDPSSASAMNSPTLTAQATAAGFILGTAAYMSPEQARGRAADKRADIWAFGVVLFEMLSGRRLFEGETISDTLAAVLRQDIDFAWLPADTPPDLVRLLRRCLERDRKNRLHDIADARIVLEEILAGGGREAAPTTAIAPPPARSRAWLWAAIGLVVGVAAGALAMRGWSFGVASAESPLVRFTIAAPPGVEFVRRPAVAADGSFVAFVGISATRTQLYVKRTDDTAPRALDHTNGAENAIISPDNRWIAFTRNGALEKVPVDGGDVLTITKEGAFGPGAVWMPDGTIVAPRNWVSGLIGVQANGGVAKPITTPDANRNERAHWFPAALPDGRHLLFTVQTRGPGLNAAEVAWLDVQTGQYTIVLPNAAAAMYVAPGYLVYLQAGSYHAIAFDASTGKTSGESVRILDDARGVLPDGEEASVGVGADGSVAYVPGPRLLETQLRWVSPGGATEALPFPARPYMDAAVSPDGQRLLVGVAEAGRYRLRLIDLARKTDEVIDMEGNNFRAKWHPDGHRFAFISQRRGDYDAYWKDLASSEPADVLLATDGDDLPEGWLPNGDAVVRRSMENGTYPVFRMTPGQPDKMTKIAERSAISAVSPDGRWFAYTGDASGRSEAYVISIDKPGVPERVSAKGAQSVAWNAKTKELYFARPPEIIAMPYTEEGGRLVPGPERLWARVDNSDPENIFAAGPDGRILVDIPPGGIPPPEIRVVLGWPLEIARKLAARR